LLGLWVRNIGEKKEKSAMTIRHREFLPETTQPF
jgi:hypothetical protein